MGCIRLIGLFESGSKARHHAGDLRTSYHVTGSLKAHGTTRSVQFCVTDSWGTLVLTYLLTYLY